MAYTALYRKYRPDTFENVIGQDHIVRTLKNQVLSGRVSHAYLFCGTRGTGKTSTAKIFAKVINCENPVDGEPCGKCAMCKAMEEGRSVNVIEIDAASNNGVDNIREIREEVKYPPSEGKFKVYIIDEVHMLSPGAFNALLKTLEEPPEHVIFILATTDPQKVPATILSRCQRFDFKRISSGEIAARLKKYLDIEGIEADMDALEYVSHLGDGSMRDSLSILDQCLSFYYGEKIDIDKVRKVSGSVDNSVIFNMTDAIASKNASKAIEIIDEIMAEGRELNRFVDEITEHLRNILVVHTIKEAENILDMSQENIDMLSKECEKISPEEAVYFINEFSNISADMKYSSNKRIVLEVGIIKLCSPIIKTDVSAMAAKIAYLEREIKNGVKVTVSAESADTEPKEKKAPKKPKPKALRDDFEAVKRSWSEITDDFEVVEKCIFECVEIGDMEDGRLSLICPDQGVKELASKKIDIVKKILSDKFGKDFEIKTVTKQEYTDWEKMVYGESSNDDDLDPEFASLVGSYFPEADIIE